MKRVSDYQKNARECRELAQKMPPSIRQQLLDMARQWERIAEERVRAFNTGKWPPIEPI